MTWYHFDVRRTTEYSDTTPTTCCTFSMLYVDIHTGTRSALQLRDMRRDNLALTQDPSAVLLQLSASTPIALTVS